MRSAPSHCELPQKRFGNTQSVTPFDEVMGDVRVTPYLSLAWSREIVTGTITRRKAIPMIHDLIHESARRRQRRKRERDFEEALPATRDIDRVIISALRDMIIRDYGGLLGNAWRSKSEVGRLIEDAVKLLEAEGFNVDHPVLTARLRHRLGDDSRDHILQRSQL